MFGHALHVARLDGIYFHRATACSRLEIPVSSDLLNDGNDINLLCGPGIGAPVDLCQNEKLADQFVEIAGLKLNSVQQVHPLLSRAFPQQTESNAQTRKRRAQFM